jgi:endonuclease-3
VPDSDPATTLKNAVAKLSRVYKPAAPLTDPLAILVWENIGYLIDDTRRVALFAEFETRIGLKAHNLANAPMPVLGDIAKRGGMHPQKRAERLIAIGRLAIKECDGDICGKLRTLPLPKARALLKKFPSVGDPGADRILLFAGIAPLPCVDSNGLRALVRLGVCAEGKSYAQAYRNAVDALASAGADNAAWLKRAYGVLREHGKALCKRAAPLCEPCPLDAICAHRPVSARM